MDEFTRDIERMLLDIDTIVLENERLRETTLFSVQEWRIAYLVSTVTLAIQSLVRRKQKRCIQTKLMPDEIIVLLFLCTALNHLGRSGIQVPQQSR
jgi:hypothetical protein